jgi:hypothetical protein
MKPMQTKTRLATLAVLPLILPVLSFAQQDANPTVPHTPASSTDTLAPTPETPAPNPATLAPKPDTPAPKQGQNNPPLPSGKKPKSAPLGLNLVARRSFFYPELATTPGPLSPADKLKLSLAESISTSRLLAAAAGAGLTQATNTPSGYGQGGTGFADRFGASMATSASSHLFGTFLLPSILHQDPRYFVHYDDHFTHRVELALRRVLITRTDSGGEAFNLSGILGPMMAESLANTYQPDRERTTARTFKRIGIRIGAGALNNLLKEYWPSIFKNLRINKVVPGLQPTYPSEPPPASQKPSRSGANPQND